MEGQQETVSMDEQGCSVAWEGVKLNTEQELLPGWMKEKDSLGSIFKDPLSKTVKNQAFRDLAKRYMEVGQCAIYFNIIDFKFIILFIYYFDGAG